MGMNDKPVNTDDVVEVLPHKNFPHLAYFKGVVLQSLNCRMAVIRCSQPQRYTDPELKEVFSGHVWILPWDCLKVIDSAFGNSVAVLEDQLQAMEDDLVIARACLSTSEEIRELQYMHIEKLTEEINFLQAEIFKLKGAI